jgi:spore germination protein YaaH
MPLGLRVASVFHRFNSGKSQWDDEEHTPWFYFTRDQMRERVFYTDRRAFFDRFLLAKQKGIEGVCSWVLA